MKLFNLVFIFITINAFSQNKSADNLLFPEEKNIKNIRQLTFGGDNAEAYFSFDNQRLIFQSNWKKLSQQGCDQMFTLKLKGNNLDYQLVSTGKGRTTCGYFLKDGRMLFASTHAASDSCPPEPPRGKKYVWPVYNSYEIYITDKKGKNPALLIGGMGYDAEATVSPNGKYIIFTSTRSGDLELWRYEIKTKKLLQLTNTLGYDGGAFFANDSKKIVWRASRPNGTGVDEYKELLKNGLVEPSDLNIYTADIEGKNVKQITDIKGANWAPFMHPDGKRIVFSSNNHSVGKPGRPRFNLFVINIDGSALKQVTYDPVFDAFPMFSFDGKKIVFSSNRNNGGGRDTNLFIADWID